MGQRISIKVLDLLNAGCMIKQVVTHYPVDGAGAAFDIYSLHVYFPQADSKMVTESESRLFIFDFESLEMIAGADYNDWGHRKPLLAPILELFKIPHEVF